MKKILEREIKALPNNFIVLTILPKNNYEELNIHLLRLLTKRCKGGGAYLAVNKPYSKLIDNLTKNKIDHSKIRFIDCVTQRTEKVDNCHFLKSAKSLTNIGIALEQAYDDENQEFLFLDSLDGLSVYHHQEILTRFMRSVIEKIRESKMTGLMIGLHKDTDKNMIDELAIICDKVIDLSK